MILKKENLYIDVGNDSETQITWKDCHNKEKNIIMRNNNVNDGIENGMVNNCEKFLNYLSCICDAIIPKKLSFNIFFTTTHLEIITRQKLDPSTQKILEDGTKQLLFDYSVFSTHQEKVVNKVLALYGENAMKFPIFSFYKREIYTLSDVTEGGKIGIYPELFIFAFKEFMDNKYKIIVNENEIENGLSVFYSINPYSIGKKKIKLKMHAVETRTKKNIVLMADFNEMAEAIRPISKAFIKILKSEISKCNQTKAYYYSNTPWLNDFLKNYLTYFDKKSSLELTQVV